MSIVKLLDGGFSGQLRRHVAQNIDGDSLWTARFLSTDPDAVYNTHLDFLRAGANMIMTNTYQASVSGLMQHLNISAENSILLIKKAAELAFKAVDTYASEMNLRTFDLPVVVGSCGPYGAYLHDGSEYTGAYGKNMSRCELTDWHRTRIRALLSSGVEMLALETIPCKEEAEALVELLREFPRARAWMSFSCRDNQHLVDGSDFKEVAVHCYRSLPSQIVAVGINCVAPECVSPLLRGINNPRIKNQESFIPLVAYPNRGGAYTINGEWTSVPDDHPISLPISEWLDMGIRYIGGCCRIFAEDIRAMRPEVDRWNCHANTPTRSNQHILESGGSNV